jgi:DNA-binding beta-propeller fold protein YncE
MTASEWHSASAPASPSTRCGICLEWIPADAQECPECGEAPASVASAVLSNRPASSKAKRRSAWRWLGLHWRPLLTIGALTSVVASGVALRYLAPNRYMPPQKMNRPAAAPACDISCWHGEACQMGRCVWEPSNEVGHVSERPTLAGPFELPRDVVDVLPLDGDRFATSYLMGVQINDARTGKVLSLVSDAPQAQRMFHVGEAIYATSPQYIYVIDTKTTRVLKAIRTGSKVSSIAVGGSGQRALASIPGQRAVAVIATDFHAEINRFYFGDDPVGPVALDDTGTRALTTNGRVPLPGLRPPKSATAYGALYAFDPARLASEQDRVRTAMVGNPVDLLMLPDGKRSLALQREEDAIVPMERLESGTVRRSEALETCDQPEQIELVRRKRRAIVRCNRGRAVDIFDVERSKLLKRVELNARAADMAITPDGRQAILALPSRGKGAIGVLDLDSYELQLHEVNGEPHRVRLAPDGKSAVVISDRSKVAWVVR